MQLVDLVEMWQPSRKCSVGSHVSVVKGHYKREFSVTQMMCDLGWQSLEAHRAFSCLPPMYNTVHGVVDVESQVLVRSGRGIRL